MKGKKMPVPITASVTAIALSALILELTIVLFSAEEAGVRSWVLS